MFCYDLPCVAGVCFGAVLGASGWVAVVFRLFVICLYSCVFVCVSISGGFVVVTVNSVGCVVLCLLRVLFVFCYVC